MILKIFSKLENYKAMLWFEIFLAVDFMLNRILMSTKPFVKSHHVTLFNRALNQTEDGTPYSLPKVPSFQGRHLLSNLFEWCRSELPSQNHKKKDSHIS